MQLMRSSRERTQRQLNNNKSLIFIPLLRGPRVQRVIVIGIFDMYFERIFSDKRPVLCMHALKFPHELPIFQDVKVDLVPLCEGS